jgi:ketosteroid isomerase-like protein
MRMKFFAICILITVSHTISAQDARKEINDQVWKPFIDAYNKFDTEKFMSVYSRNVVRVPVDQKMIFDFTEYKKNINRENQFNKNYNIKAALDIHFTTRIHSKDIAYEAGVLKINLTDNNGKPATIYSKFQVLLKKENGVWKIQFDSDSTESNRVSEKDFAAGDAMQ